MTELFNDNGAIFNEDRTYRYALWRVWDNSKPKIMFIGLNPSTANEMSDDPTIRRVKKFAATWGYGGAYMLNLFAFVSSDPKKLVFNSHEKVGYHNDRYLREYADKSAAILFAWGNFKEAEQRAIEVAEMFTQAVCLGINKNGSPKHPLYISSKTLHVNYK